MRIRYPLLLLVVLTMTHTRSSAQGFPSNPFNWQLPLGGSMSNTHSFGFNNIASTGSYTKNDQGWSVLDIDGDGKLDLVVHCEGDSSHRNTFGVNDGNQYWKVYKGNGSGFSQNEVHWSLPNGGDLNNGYLYGFYTTAHVGSYQAGDQAWSLTDMNADGKPDLVVNSEGNGTYRDVFGLGTSPYWKVYYNNGSGFSQTPKNWSVPDGGHTTSTHQFGFNNIADAGSYEANDQGWLVTDITGDGIPDLIVHSQGDGSYRDGFDVGTNPYWKVYQGGTSGFAASPLTWKVPAGGHTSSTHAYGFNNLSYTGGYNTGDHSWAVMDMDGDKKPDLVIYAEGTGSYRDAYDVGNNSYWKVYTNSGYGFTGSFSKWNVPDGGYLYNGHNYGFSYISYSGSYSAGNQGWSTMDMTGDGLPDLVIHSQGDGTYRDAFSVGNNPYWKVYQGNENGFSASDIHWSMPDGGHVSSTHTFGFNNIGDAGSYDAGDQGWALLDMNGDGKTDLVVHSEGNGSTRDVYGVDVNPYWKVYLNTMTNGLNDEPEVEWMKVYPNPTSGAIILKQNLYTRPVPFTLLDHLGRTISSGQTTGIETRINIAGFPSGIYMIRINNGEQTLKVAKQD
ncbi:MAG: T9SS type A sorting domain-containing protein [Flavobacteriales bacterium]|nr:T9SS type A sorting domain-containing protein [Flavobacteriales bacterium]MCB9448284.1 T9SS type A sorting domain-containing protein [Flavobacteriales bacterium]